MDDNELEIGKREIDKIVKLVVECLKLNDVSEEHILPSMMLFCVILGKNEGWSLDEFMKATEHAWHAVKEIPR